MVSTWGFILHLHIYIYANILLCLFEIFHNQSYKQLYCEGEQRNRTVARGECRSREVLVCFLRLFLRVVVGSQQN